jgi:protocatechuate 3,4-dioxygenase beta subunit
MHWRFTNRIARKAIARQVRMANCLAAALLLPMLETLAASSDSERFAPLDVSRFATSGWTTFRPWITWNGPPGGLQRLDGVPFQIDGVIQFKSLNPKALGDLLPTRVKGIVVGRRFTALHLLHCSEFPEAPREPVVKLILHYSNQQEEEFVLRYGVHFEDWYHPLQGLASADTTTHNAWIAPPRTDQSGPWGTALWHTVLVNPRPEVGVVSFEVRSLFSQARYTLVAATTESGAVRSSAPTNKTQRIPADREPVTLRFRLVDAEDGTPIALARVQATAATNSRSSPWDTVETDSQGEAILCFPSRMAAMPIELLATGPNHIAAKFSAAIDPQNTPCFKMHRGQSIGGRVVDERGRPIAGAAINVAGPQADDSGRLFVAKWSTATTDTNGIWSLGCAPPAFTRLILTIQRSQLLPAVIYEQDDTGVAPFSVRGEALSQRKAVFQVKSGIEFSGKVTCAGQAIPQAQVALFYGETAYAARLTAWTDKGGRFAFPGLEPSPVSVLITAGGFAPALQKLEITTNSVAMVLERGKTVQAFVRDESGRPLARTLFQVTSWQGDAWLQHSGYSDAEGKFRWESAPAAPATFTVFHPGFRVLPNVPLDPGAAPRVLVLVRQDQRGTE